MFSKAPNLKYSISPFVFLYCDIVQASTLGHLSVPILKIIPIQLPPIYNTSGSFHEFDVLEYVSVAKKSMQTVGFKICSHDGTLVSYDDGPVRIKLTFRKSI